MHVSPIPQRQEDVEDTEQHQKRTTFADACILPVDMTLLLDMQDAMKMSRAGTLAEAAAQHTAILDLQLKVRN